MSLRSLFVFPFFLLVTMVMSLAALGIGLFDPSGDRVHRLAVWWSKIMLFLSGVRVRVKGDRAFNPEGSYIFAANHQSIFDIPVLLVSLPVQFRWLAKESLFRIPLFGWAMKRAGYIPIDRSNPRSAYRSLLAAVEMVKQGKSIVIFPEGTRQETAQMGSFKKGGFLLALKSQSPILPVSIIGSAQVLTKNGFWITPGEIQVVLGQAIPTRGLQNQDAEALMQQVRRAIEANLR